VSPNDPEVRQPVTFDASPTRDEGVPCEGGCTFEWRFGDGAGAAGSIVSHRFATAGSYAVSLIVTDAASSTAEATKTVTVHAVAPPSVVLTVSPSAPVAGQQVSFTAATTVPRGHGIVAYEWDFGNGTRRTTPAATTIAAYESPGRYTATVVAIDDLGQRGSAAAAVVVADAFTFPDPVFAVSPSAPAIGATVVLNAAGITAANGAAIVLYEWDFGDGSPSATTTGGAVRHAFREPGTYIVRLTVTDSLGRVATRTRNVAIIEP
jgi:PKD repeat protein